MKLPLRIIFLFGIFTANNLKATAASYYRSAASGNWTATATWQVSSDNINWSAATSTPTYNDNSITVLSGDSVTITTGITIDQVTVESGAVLNVAVSISSLAIRNGTGVDLDVKGTLYDNIGGGYSILFYPSASWQMSANANFIKTTSSASNNWQQSYENGIQNIPSTANWIIRKNSTQNPSITTVGAYYPNLIIENYTSSIYVTPTVAASFNGSSNYPTILGNLDIGGCGTTGVSFYNGQANSNPTKVCGNFIVRSGSIFRNYGTGIQIKGDVQIDGTLSYDNDDRRLIDFIGSNQSLSGMGSISIYNMRMKSTGKLTLNTSIAVDDTLYLQSGYIVSSNSNLISLTNNSIVSGASTNSFVAGPLRRYGADQFVFPIGIDGIYKPLTISDGGATTDSYIAEYFYDNPRIVISNLFNEPIDHISGCEYWQLTKESGTLSRNISLYWDAYSCGVTDLSDLRIVYFDSSLSMIWNSAGTTSISGSTISGTISSTAINKFGYFTLASITQENPLPIQLIDFNGSLESDGIHLHWTTASEVNNDHFEIMSSDDGFNFKTIASVQGNGTTTISHQYEFVDNHMRSNVVYYKLKQVDYDGHETLSQPITITITTTHGLFKVYDSQGKFVMNTTDISSLGLPSGMYFIALGERFKKIVIQ